MYIIPRKSEIKHNKQYSTKKSKFQCITYANTEYEKYNKENGPNEDRHTRLKIVVEI